MKRITLNNRFTTKCRYEWAIGFTSSDLPEHVIDNSTETLWHHSGQIMEATYCLPRGIFCEYIW